MLGLAGLFSLYFGFQAMVMALVLGGCVALVATRSIVAAATAVGVLVAGAIPYLWNGTTLGWAILLLLVSLGDRRLHNADDRLLRYFAGPAPISRRPADASRAPRTATRRPGNRA